MTALAKQDTREVARPLKVLEKLIKEDIESATRPGWTIGSPLARN